MEINDNIYFSELLWGLSGMRHVEPKGLLLLWVLPLPAPLDWLQARLTDTRVSCKQALPASESPWLASAGGHLPWHLFWTTGHVWGQVQASLTSAVSLWATCPSLPFSSVPFFLPSLSLLDQWWVTRKMTRRPEEFLGETVSQWYNNGCSEPLFLVLFSFLLLWSLECSFLFTSLQQLLS